MYYPSIYVSLYARVTGEDRKVERERKREKLKLQAQWDKIIPSRGKNKLPH